MAHTVVVECDPADAVRYRRMFARPIAHVPYNAFCGSSITFIDMSGCCLAHVGRRAFAECVSLRRVRMGASLVHLGRGTFKNCTSLEHIDLRLSSRLLIIPREFAKGCVRLDTVLFADSVLMLASESFRETGLRTVALPSSVLHVSRLAFSYCTALVAVQFAGDLASVYIVPCSVSHTRAVITAPRRASTSTTKYGFARVPNRLMTRAATFDTKLLVQRLTGPTVASSMFLPQELWAIIMHGCGVWHGPSTNTLYMAPCSVGLSALATWEAIINPCHHWLSAVPLAPFMEALCSMSLSELLAARRLQPAHFICAQRCTVCSRPRIHIPYNQCFTHTEILRHVYNNFAGVHDDMMYRWCPDAAAHAIALCAAVP